MNIENNYNYPIKYAVLELKESGGYPVGYKDIVRGNIVSKCYVVESSIKYSSNGDSQIFHKVVFPFSSLETLKLSLRNHSKYIGEKTVPSYDANYNPYPVAIVSDLFDSYEEAKVKAQEQNEKMRHQIALTAYEEKFIEQLTICQLFEEIALLNTRDMNITYEINENKNLQLLK